NFFFSSRRRHTRWPRDWSSDVCSSDLVARGLRPGGTASPEASCDAHAGAKPNTVKPSTSSDLRMSGPRSLGHCFLLLIVLVVTRSEERRVGQECRCRWEWR